LIAEGNPALGLVGTDRALRLGSRPVLTKIAKAWQEFTAKAEYAYDYGMPRWIARTDHFLSRLQLERLFLGHHKFYHFRIWYKKQLKGYLESLGLDAAANEPSCYRPGACKELIEAHLSGQRNHTLALHKLLTVHLIDRLLIRQS
jgi:asparagine synthase (glutamine-hydrolysing)